jgi:hypothetical protein
MLSFVEGIINLILSISLIRILGIYWILWASVISRVIKILCFEGLALMKGNKYSTQFSIEIKKLKFLLLLFLLSISQELIIHFISIDVLRKMISQILMFSIFLIEALVFSLIWFFSCVEKNIN